jgi:hypothetical protein
VLHPQAGQTQAQRAILQFQQGVIVIHRTEALTEGSWAAWRPHALVDIKGGPAVKLSLSDDAMKASRGGDLTSL